MTFQKTTAQRWQAKGGDKGQRGQPQFSTNTSAAQSILRSIRSITDAASNRLWAIEYGLAERGYWHRGGAR